MKNSTLLLVIIFANFSVWAQYNTVPLAEKNNAPCIPYKAQQQKSKTLQQNIKAPGDIIWSEDFNMGLPTNWTLTDISGIGGWIYNNSDTTYTGANTNQGAYYINSETSTNGYMYIPADYYNCVPNVWPREQSATLTEIDAVMETDWIDLYGGGASSGYILKFATWFRLCCSDSDAKLDINIATIDAPDTWITLNGREISGITVPINGYPDGNIVAYPVKNLSNIIGTSSQIKIQFHMHGSTHYHWFIDDIQLIETFNNDVFIADYYASPGQVYTINYPSYNNINLHNDYNRNYSEIPANIQSLLQLGVLVNQNGLNANNVRAEFSIDSAGISFWPDSPPEISTTTIPSLTFDQDSVLYTDTSNAYINAPYFYNTDITATDFEIYGMMEDGIPYTISYNVASDNTDDNPDNNNAIYQFAQTNGRYSYHWQPNTSTAVSIENETGPFSYTGPTGESGDIYANQFDFYQEEGDEFKIFGVRLYIPISNNVTFDGAGDGVTLTPVMYFYDHLANSGAGDWIENEDVYGMPYTLQESDEGAYIMLPFVDYEVINYTFPHGQHFIGVKIEDYNGQKVAIGVDQTYRQGDSHFLMKIAPYEDTWYYWRTNGSAMIDVYTTIEEINYFYYMNSVDVVEKAKSSGNIKIYPNPTTGIVKLENVENTQISIYSITGNLVKTIESTSVNRSIDLSHLAKGTYLLKIVKEQEVLTKKINIIR